MKKSFFLSRRFDLQTLKVFFIITAIEGVASFLLLISLPKSAENTWLFGYSLNRVAVILVMFLVSLGLVWFTFNFWRRNKWQDKFLERLEHFSRSEPAFDLVLNILSALFIVIVFLWMLWGITKDVFYLSYFVRFGPTLLFTTLVVLQTLGLLLFQIPKDKRTAGLWSLLFGAVLICLQEYPLIVYNKIGDIFIVLVMLVATFYVQIMFYRSFHKSVKRRIGWPIAMILVWLLILMEFSFIPKKFLPYLQSFYIFSPIIMIVLAVSAKLAYSFFLPYTKTLFYNLLMYLFILIGFVYLGNLYYFAGVAHAKQVNTTYMTADDELAYMDFAIEAKETNFRYTGTRNQMPVYPYIQALFYKSDMSLDDFFTQGKQVNILLSLALLAIIFLVTQKFLSLGETVNLILVTAFGLYVLKSGYFMSELLYYTLSFLSYLFMSISLVKPSIKLSIATGILLGISHLTKASILPGLLLFIGVFVLKELTNLFLQRKDARSVALDQLPLKFKLVNLLLAMICFLGVVFPYISESKRVYGSYFYNVNSTFYMWYDSYEEAILGTMAHGDGYRWPDMPSEDIPSPAKYFREHDLSMIWERIQYGLHWQVENIRYQYSFFNYPMFFLAFASFVFLLDIKTSIQTLKKYLPVVIFAFSYILAYFVLYVWYSAIASMPRFLFALYLPLLFSLYIAVKALASELSHPFIKIANLTVFAMVLIDIWYIISWGPFHRDFGS